MTERTIDDLLGRLPGPIPPRHDFDVRLRAALTAELRAEPDVASRTPFPDEHTTTEVIELKTMNPPTTSTDKASSGHGWWRAAAAVALVGGVVATLVVLSRDDSSTNVASDTTVVDPTVQTLPVESTVETSPVQSTSVASTTTFVEATVESFPVELGRNPYFVGAADAPWVGSLAGELARLDPDTGAIVLTANVSESSAFAVDPDAVWVADAITGDVVRLDPNTGAVTATIPTGVEIVENSIRLPMFEGQARSFADIGGITSSEGSVWVGDRAGTVMRIDPATNEIVDVIDVPVRPLHVRVDDGNLLVAELREGQLAVVDMADGTVRQEFSGPNDLSGAELYGGAVYFQDITDGTVTRIDLATGERTTSVALGESVENDFGPTLPTGLVVTGAGVLVDVNTAPDSIHVLDPLTLVSLGTLAVEADQGDMTISADGSVWLVRTSANQVVHITPVAAGAG